MQFMRFPLPGPVAITPRKHGDARGYFAETFREADFQREVGVVHFVQENQSFSAGAGTVRGLHFQTRPFAQGKLVRCVAGAIFDVAVDLRHDSPHYGAWLGVELTAEALNQLWVPPGFAHGFCTLTPGSVVCYKVTAPYSPAHDHGVAWDDADIGVTWPALADAETLSGKDGKQPAFRALPRLFTCADWPLEGRDA